MKMIEKKMCEWKSKMKNISLKKESKAIKRITNIVFNRKTLGKIGYYSSLAALLIVLGIASRNYRTKTSAPLENESTVEPQIVSAVVTPAPMTTPIPTAKPIEYFRPVSGEILTKFEVERLVWSETLSQWQTHPAVDILGNMGESVLAICDGVIKDAYEDALWGNVVVIDHGEEIISVYSNLSTLNLVQIGEKVAAGETIGAIGKSAAAETDMPPHLHLELLQDETPIDFEKFFKEKAF